MMVANMLEDRHPTSDPPSPGPPATNGWAGIGAGLAAGAIGAALFVAARLPLPWMLGSLFGAFVAANLLRVRVARPAALAGPVRAVLGVAVGAAFSPALVDAIGAYLLSLALLPLFLSVAVWLGMIYYERLVGLDRHTAFFCALPGGLIELTLIAEGYGADMRRVALVQTTRVLMIVYTVPFAIDAWTHVDLSGRTPLPAGPAQMSAVDAAMLIVAAAAGWWLMRRLRLPGATIVGPMLASAALHAGGLVEARVPQELINAAQWVLGAGIGCAFVGIGARELGRTAAMTLGYFAILMALAAGCAWLISSVIGIPPVAAALAFVPGGQAEMNVIAITVGVAVPYIALHHILRMILVMTIAPPLSRRLLGKRI